jgi:hypothetical protein
LATAWYSDVVRRLADTPMASMARKMVRMTQRRRNTIANMSREVNCRPSGLWCRLP